MNKTPGRFRFLTMFRAPALGAILCAIGCHSAESPFNDPLADESPATTASVDAARSLEREQEIRRRGFADDIALTSGTAVAHTQLYWECPFEEPTSECSKCANRFAWSAEDYISFVYSPGRFLANTVLYPLSIVIDPPWITMESDGVPGRRRLREMHDAHRVQ
jgi:hypothetical protein